MEDVIRMNFKVVPVVVSPDGKIEDRDLRKDFGNFLWNYSYDVALAEIGRDIYNSDGEIEIPGSFRDVIADMINRSTYYYPIRAALLKQLMPDK